MGFITEWLSRVSVKIIKLEESFKKLYYRQTQKIKQAHRNQLN